MNWCIEQIFVGIALLIFAFTLAGCWDRVELENRDFAVALGIDENDGYFEFAVARTRNEAELPAQGSRLIEAIHSFDAVSSRKLFLGQAKTVVFGRNLLENEQKFREAVNVLESRSDIDRSINVIAAASNVPEILFLSPPGEEDQGYYAVNFSQLAPKSGGKSFKQNFEPMMAGLRESGTVLIPLIEEENGIRIEGAAVINDYKMAGKLDGKELRGLLWAESRACNGAIITDEQQNIPMTVRRHRSNFRFSEVDGVLRALIDVRIKGEAAQITALGYEQFIAQEMENSIRKIQHELKADALGLRRALQKEQYSLYLRYADEPAKWKQTYAEMEIIPLVRCVILS